MSETAPKKHSFYVTFGQKYKDTPHPYYPKAHPDGWVRIVSSSYQKARSKAFDMFGPYFSSLYTENDSWGQEEWYKLGEIEVIEID
jgi:hypothetical protein